MKKVVGFLILFLTAMFFSQSPIIGRASEEKSLTLSIKKEKGVPYIVWDDIENASGYEIQVCSSKKGTYSLLAVVDTNKYNSSNLVTTKKKYFRIVPFYDGNVEVTYGQPSKVKKVNINRIKLSAKGLCQYPELQTGCEATALTVALNYHGFNVKKTTIASNYMPIKSSGFGDIYNYFLGDPYGVGMGIYAPGLIKTANNYLKTKNTKLRASDISGSSINKICKYVSEGYPVCIWVTCNIYKEPSIDLRWTYNNKKYEFSYDEHCVTVIGFDKEKDTVIVADPLSGIREYPRNKLAKRYKQMGKMAMVIK